MADNGHGIRPDLLPTIFERFRQGDSSSTREYGGLGLGLAIARQLVEMHGGTISAESPGVGLGASFTVSLPILALRTDSQRFANAIVPLEPSDMTSVDLSGARVFLVEDDPDSRNMLVRILTSCGAEVGEASSVELALERLAHFEPDVLISDLGMPGRDGFDLIRELRQRGYTIQQLPAIALTAFARTEDRTRALLGGFQVHLAKPVDPHELTSAIASFLDRTD